MLPLFLILFLLPIASSKLSNATLNIPGRLQWPDRDGYCGSNTIQMNALNFGAYISQGVIRSAVSMGNCGGGGDGNEILHTNVPCVLKELQFNHTAWDYHNQPQPQSTNYLIWVKNQLARGWPVVMFIFCKGDSHRSHGSEKGYGNYDHIEPIVGVLSNHSLELDSTDVNTYYSDDVLVHHSDWTQKYYYRSFDSMADTKEMNGNCKHVEPRGGGPNEAYPCIPKEIDYGYALADRFDPYQMTYPTHLSINHWKEPDIVEGQSPIGFVGTIQISLLQKGMTYSLLRYDDYQSIPKDGDFQTDSNYTTKTNFLAKDAIYKWIDPVPIQSNASTYYYCIENTNTKSQSTSSPLSSPSSSSPLSSTISTLIRLTAPNAICLDGNPGGYYIKNGTGSGVNKWAIHHQGGGWCQMETPYQTWPNDNCLDRANTTLGTLERDPLHQDWSSTLGCASCSNHFKSNWNHVYIRYCDGGTYAGTLNHSFAGKYSNGTVGEVFFQGKYILQDVIQSLKINYGDRFIKGNEFVIGGSSAGGLAVYLHLDWWRKQLPSNAIVVGLADSGYFLDWTLNTTSAHSYDSDLRWGFENMHLSNGVNQKCIQEQKATNQPKSNCIFAKYTLPHVATPIFVLQSLFDSWQLQWEHGIEHQGSSKKISNFVALNKYGDRLKTSIASALQKNTVGTIGGFIERCFHHCTTKELWTSTPTIHNLTQQESFSIWYDAVKQRNIEVGEGSVRSKGSIVIPTVLWQEIGTLPCTNCNCPTGMVGPKY